MSNEPGPSYVSSMPGLSPSSTGTFSSVGIAELDQFKNQILLQMMQLQRWLKELQNNQTLEKTNTVSFAQTLNLSKNQAKAMETRLANLQKIVAVQADTNKKLQKETTDKNATTHALIEVLGVDLAAVKTTMENLMRQVEELRRSGGGGSGSANISLPDNLNEMFEALERQLGTYDVKLAEMDLRFQVLETTNYDGKLVWKIRDFDRRREDAKRGRALSIYSQPFYTSRYGYKMCLRVYLNGDGMGKNTHISLFFVLMKGEYDAILQFPFRQKVTLMLLDQGPDRRHLSDVFRPDPTSSSFKKPTSDMNIASGCPMFVAHDTINRSSYVKEDTIFIRVVVETTDLENF
uniref:TNF receptor-associated factor 3-like n=1 Tax=Styela clava TaxID=7725 RepID=UPI001939DE73|nr:TNF receptor-associated factor 3-like [Styela clava]